MTQAEAPVREGDILAGKYRVEKVLGVGGMGVVVAALHTELDQRVALKFLLPDAASNPEVVARFSREARAAAKIKSEHVVRVSDVGTMDGGVPYIVMEYLEGADLSDLLEKKGPFPVAAAVDHVLEACEAIAEAHAAGIIHRDLKPANLFLARQADGTEIVKVLDFGISKALGSELTAADAALTKTSDVFGSPMYMSPEQLRSSRNVDARADVWALGVILFEIVTGKAPFDRGTVAEIFGSILHEPAPLLGTKLAGAPEGLEHIVARCLEKQVDARFPNVAELARALGPYGTGSARSSVDRASRVLRRAGVTIASVPPGPLSSGEVQRSSVPSVPGPPSVPSSLRAVAVAAATAAAVPSVGASTKTSWGAANAAPRRSRSGARAALLALGLAVIAGGGLFARSRLRPATPVVAAPVDAPAQPPPARLAAPPAIAPKPPEIALPAPPPPAQSATATPTVAPVETAAPASPGKQRPVAKPPPGHAPPPPAPTAAASVAPPPVATATVAPVATEAPPPTPPPAPPPAPKPAADDPEGFGDRR